MSDERTKREASVVRTEPAKSERGGGIDQLGFEFERIYFDTNALWADRWPNASPSLLTLLGVARVIDVQCIIPEPVGIELEEKWIRELELKEQGLNLHLQRVKGPRIKTYPSRESLLGAHRIA